MRPRPTLSKPPASVCLAPVRSSTYLPSLSFQSFTNCPRFATHSEPLSFQPITNCPVCKSFVLITIQQCRGVGGSPSAPTFQLSNLQTSQHSMFRIFFQVPYALTPLFATLAKTAGVYTLSSQTGIVPINYLRPPDPPSARAEIRSSSTSHRHESQVTFFRLSGAAEFFSISVAAHEQNPLCYTEPVLGKLAS